MQNKYLTKIITFLMTIIILLAVFSGCSQKVRHDDLSEETNGNVNTTYEEGMDLLTVTGKTVNGGEEQIVPFPELGFAQLIPESWGNL